MANLSRAPVQPLRLPLPASLFCPAQETLDVFILEAARKDQVTGVPLVCRIDLLPSVNPETKCLEWCVSEMEGMWAECFLRAATSDVCQSIAQAILLRAGGGSWNG